MSILDRLSGVFVALAYGLERAKMGSVRLRVAAILWCCFFAAYLTYRGWRAGFELVHGAVVILCLVFAALLLWADRHHYTVFREQPAVPTGEVPDLCAEERLQLRGSGLFQVSDMSRYLVEVPVVFWTTRLAEHIVAARVQALNILGSGVPSEERGWWYIFIEPKYVVGITPGYLCFGVGLRPAVRIEHEAQKTRQPVFLSCDSVEQRARLLKELASRAQAAHQRTR